MGCFYTVGISSSDNLDSDLVFEGAFIRGDARHLLTCVNGPCAITTAEWNLEEEEDGGSGGTRRAATRVDFLPVFLQETKRYNAVWLAALRSRTQVDLFVERVIPVQAKFFRLSPE